MMPVDIDAPIELRRGFWLIYAIVALPMFWVVHRWLWHGPLYADIATLLLLPFLAALVIYCVLLAVTAAAFGGPEQRAKFLRLLCALTGAAAGVGLSWMWFGSRYATPAGTVGYILARILSGLIYPRTYAAKPAKSETEADFEAFKRPLKRRDSDQ